jgi:hypothetical protein
MKEYTVKVYDDGTKEWWLHGKRHREDGPAIEGGSGYKQWWLNGVLHREDGPAYECVTGTKSWWLHGLRHREGAPAVEHANGTKYWYQNNQLHREDGPAVEKRDNRYNEWWLNGKFLSEQEFNDRNKPMELTMQQIAEKFNVSVDKLRIKD